MDNKIDQLSAHQSPGNQSFQPIKPSSVSQPAPSVSSAQPPQEKPTLPIKPLTDPQPQIQSQSKLEPAQANEPNLAIQQPGFTQQEVKPVSWTVWLKLAYIVLFLAAALTGAFFLTRKISGQYASQVDDQILLQVPYQPVLWKDFGEVFEPLVEIPVYYPSKGFIKKSFLLDSGALVSSLPREEAKNLGLSLAKLPRSTFAGFGGTTSFAYRGEIKIKLGEQELEMPVVFTEAAGTKPILGRSGFFEKHSIYFNAKRERIEIRK